MATPANRILVVYIAAAATDGEANPAVIDAVATRGCSGFLILPAKHDKLHALLGVDLDAPENPGSLPYPKMPLAIFSDSTATCDSVKALGIANVHILSSTESHEPMAARVESLLQPQDDPKAKQLVVVHLSQYQPTHWIFKLVEKLLGSETTASPDDCFVSIVRDAEQPHRIDPAVANHPLRPRQSFERHHGKYAETYHTRAVPSQRLLVSSYHSNRTHCDLAMRFDESEIDARGAYGAMDARIFMKEMAFRLGFAPKYGA